MALRRDRRARRLRLTRRLIAVGLVVLVTAVTGIWLLAPPERLAARYGAADCRRVTLIDRTQDWEISGAEALALSPDGSVILAAHDRLADLPAPGGLFEVTPFALLGSEPVAVRPIYTWSPGALLFRPHGLALSPDGTRLATINRFAPGEAAIEIGPLADGTWTPDRRIEGNSLCRANGLAFTGEAEDALVISLDRAECETALTDLLPEAATGRLARFDGTRFEITREGLAFPNGVLGPFIAETRANRILRPGADPIPLPGGPDNLTAGPDGKLLTAVHPRLHLLWLYLQGWQRRAPSRILAVDPETGAVEVLFDDPGGRIFSGATGAVMAGDMLIAGSARDKGLLVCGGGI